MNQHQKIDKQDSVEKSERKPNRKIGTILSGGTESRHSTPPGRKSSSGAKRTSISPTSKSKSSSTGRTSKPPAKASGPSLSRSSRAPASKSGRLSKPPRSSVAPKEEEEGATATRTSRAPGRTSRLSNAPLAKTGQSEKLSQKTSEKTTHLSRKPREDKKRISVPPSMSDNDARVSSPPKNAEADAAKDDDEHIPFAALNWNTAPGQQSKKDDDTMEILLDDEPSVEDDGPFEDQRGKPLNIQDLTAPLTEPMSSPAQSVPPQVLQPIPTAQVTDEDEYDSDVTPISGRKKRFPVVIAAGIVALVGGIGAAVFMFSTDSADDKEAPMKQASMLPMEGDVNIKPFNNTQENPPSPSPLEAKAAASPAPTPTPNAEPADEEAKSTESPGPEKSDEQEAATPAASASPAPAKPTAGGKKAPTRSTRSTVSSRSSSKPVVEKAPEKSDDAPKKKATTLSSILNGTDDSMKKMPISRSREAVQKAMRKVAKFAKRCSRTEKRLVTVSLTINTKGRVTRAAPMGDFKGTEVGRCVALAAKSAVFPPALKPMTLQYPLHP